MIFFVRILSAAKISNVMLLALCLPIQTGNARPGFPFVQCCLLCYAYFIDLYILRNITRLVKFTCKSLCFNFIFTVYISEQYCCRWHFSSNFYDMESLCVDHMTPFAEAVYCIDNVYFHFFHFYGLLFLHWTLLGLRFLHFNSKSAWIVVQLLTVT